MTTPSPNPRLAHALTVMAHEAAVQAQWWRHETGSREDGQKSTERAIAFARAADEADGLVSP